MKIFNSVLLFFIITVMIYGQGNKDAVIQYELKEGWTFKQADKENWMSATVPGCVHTDLLYNKIIPDPFYRTNEKDLQWIDKHDWIYESKFTIDTTFYKNEKIELIFKGLDTYAEVFLNESKILFADNMFREWKVDCKKIINVGENTLTILLNSPIKNDLPKLKKLGYDLPASNDQSEIGGLENQRISVFARKAPYHYGWDWGPRFVTSGIWRPIILRGWNSVAIENVQIAQISLSSDLANLNVNLEINSSVEEEALLILYANDEIVSSKIVSISNGLNNLTAEFEIINPRLWYPNGIGEPYLYSLKAELKLSDNTIANIEDKFGLRKIEVIQEPDSSGRSFYFKINGHPVFMKGANYIPSDNFLNRVTMDDYKKIILSAKEANMNMIRIWGGGIYENDVFYDLCDENGILVWQDFMFACSMYPGDEEFLNNVKQEVIDNVKRLRNHPSIAIWCGNNEVEDAWANWGWKILFNAEQQNTIYKSYREIFLNIIPSVVKEYDGTRFYWPSSPSSDYGRPSNFTSGDLHYWGVWHGKEPFEDFNKKVGRFVSEYGFQSFPEFKTVKSYTAEEDWDIESKVMSAHQRSGIGNLRIRDYMEMYYKTPKDFESFLYVGQVLQGYGIKQAIEAHRRAMPYCMGSLYWQLNDCWPVASWSSTDYYKRWKAVHYKVKNAFEQIIISPVMNKSTVDVYIVSDLLESKRAKLEIASYDLNGKKIFFRTVPVIIKANSSSKYVSLTEKSLLKGYNKKNIIVFLKLKLDNEIFCSNEFFFVEPKDLRLSKPNVKVSINKIDQGYNLELTTDKFAKDIFISSEDEGFFSDNYFDLIPGSKKSVIFMTNKNYDNIENKIKITSLFNSYN